MANHRVVLSFSILTGTLVTAGLIICINLLAYPRIPPAIERPLLVVNLMSWHVPEKIIPKMKTQTPKKSVLKTSVKTAAKAIVKPKPVAKPRQEIVTQETSVPSEHLVAIEKTVTAKEDVLPTPAPIFQITLSPRFLHRQEPIFPETMRAEGISGEVKLEALIDKQGRVRQVNIIQSAGRYFDAAAKTALLASSFYPAKIGDEPVAVLLRLPVRFGLL